VDQTFSKDISMTKKGYFNDEEKTKDVLFDDGWFATGDIGRFNLNGTLSIIDRKKNIFKLSQGEYVAVEYLEGVYKRCQFVGQIWVYGNSLKRYLIAVVVPNWDYLIPWAKSKGITNLKEEDLCNDKTVQKEVLEDIIQTGKGASLQPFELIKTLLCLAYSFMGFLKKIAYLLCLAYSFLGVLKKIAYLIECWSFFRVWVPTQCHYFPK